MNNIKKLLQTRLGFFSLAVIIFWIKTYIGYQAEFSLGVEGIMQQFILLINPIATTILLFSIALYFKSSKKAYIALIVVYTLMSILFFSNVLYYREFSDFLSVSTILGAGNVSGGLGASTFALLHATDFLFLIDILLLIVLLATKKITLDTRPFKKRYAFAATIVGFTLLAGNLALAESDRPQLLARTFDRNYIVKYLGLNFFTAYDGYQTAQANQVKANADESDIEGVLTYVNDHFAEADAEMFGIAEDRNVIFLHLESFQQFLIDYKLETETGESLEVTPFINSIYHNNDTQSFSNFFHQVGQGKTSDSEMLLENSLFGLPQGGAFTQVGESNTFQSASQILGAEKGYTSAMFHGNVGSFWNRDNTYKSMGIDYFFDDESYSFTDENTLEYGMKDKIFFKESVQYLEQLPQPFYSKFITVSNHFPYPLDEANVEFPAATTGDNTIDNYFVTAHYLDQAIEEFFTYLKESGLYDNSVIVLYGDHYGISNSRNETLAPLLGKDPETWSSYDNAMLQRVPYMIHIPGSGNGKINTQYGGQVDSLPTLLHLLGVETKDNILLGTDLLSPNHDQTVAFRDGNFVSPKYTVDGSSIYDTETGVLIEDPSEEVLAEVEQLREDVTTQLSLSDSILTSDLLRFYTPEGLVTTDPADYDYRNQLQRMKAINESLGTKATSIYSQNGNKSTIDLYKTDAPELTDKPRTVDESLPAETETPDVEVTE
ncbi:sulfatase domain protein [Carnobacterium sp. AT7]|uniref:LTA synthase family protein n=1 Tax=Carnobacterium TaxID=2747 RepID=UPI00015F2DB2|nr:MULTISPECIES: LTA synthase family protein [Carnobacterium]EDP69354.1 sulfatase domain protein [Carnobacterium sp. AT7]